MKQLFGDQELALDVKKIKTTLIRNMLQVHLASVEMRLESCQRCPLITENPSGFKAERSIDPVSKYRLQNYPGLPAGYPIPYYRGIANRIRERRDPVPEPTPDPPIPVPPIDQERVDGARDEYELIRELGNQERQRDRYREWEDDFNQRDRRGQPWDDQGWGHLEQIWDMSEGYRKRGDALESLVDRNIVGARQSEEDMQRERSGLQQQLRDLNAELDENIEALGVVDDEMKEHIDARVAGETDLENLRKQHETERQRLQKRIDDLTKPIGPIVTPPARKPAEKPPSGPTPAIVLQNREGDLPPPANLDDGTAASSSGLENTASQSSRPEKPKQGFPPATPLQGKTRVEQKSPHPPLASSLLPA